MTTNDLAPEDIVDRLERALAALAGANTLPLDLDPDLDAVGSVARGSGAAGLLLSAALGLFVELGAADVPTAQHALVLGLDSHAGDAREGIATLMLNIIEAWMLTRSMHEAITGEQALSVVDHITEARQHIEHVKDAHYIELGDDLADLHDDLAGNDITDDEDNVDQAAAADGALDRITDATAALGIIADIQVAGPAGVEHAGFPVALAVGILTGRATIELVNACATIPDEVRGAIPAMWVEGFRYGVTVAPGNPPPDDLVAGAMLRIVNLIGAWHLSPERNNARSDAIGHLLTAAMQAGRADGLAGASVDLLAEFIAHRGSDHTDAHASALESAEAGLEALQKVDRL